jgi:hypothetical protein
MHGDKHIKNTVQLSIGFRRLLVPIQRRMNQLRNVPLYFFKVDFNIIILPTMPSSFELSLYFSYLLHEIPHLEDSVALKLQTKNTPIMWTTYNEI